jgi:hypothetical protein
LDGWITVNRHGHYYSETSVGTVKQGFRIHGFLVDEDDLDAVLDTDPFGKIPDFDFSPMAYGSRTGQGKYWEEDLTRDINDVEAKRFVMDFQKDAPLVDPGFVEYHDLIEKKKRNFETYDTDETVVRFTSEKWKYLSSQSDHWGLDDTIQSLEVRAEYLKDYLEERGCALVLAYFQKRDAEATNEELSLPTDDRTDFMIQGGKAVRVVRRTQPGYEIHWFCPIRPNDIPYGRKERLMEDRRNLRFRTKQGYRFSKEEAINEEGFSEAGYRRPALGAESLEEAVSFFGWTFFEPEVLEKYQNDSRGSVSEWSEQGLQIEWLDKMSLRAYRNNDDLVLIIVDDLSHVPDEELSHWYHHNTSPEGEIPDEMITNYIEADFVDSESPAEAVINAITELDEAFEAKYDAHLYRDTGDDIDSERMLTLPRNERRALFNVISEADQVAVENLIKSNLEENIPEEIVEEEISGEKDALYNFVKELADSNKARDILSPINAMHDFRDQGSHRQVNRGGWSRAVETLDYDEDTDEYRQIYRDTMRGTAASLREITKLIERHE